MSCKTLQLNKCEIKGSTFSGRKFTFQNRDISNDKFKVVGYNNFKSTALFTIDGVIIGNSVYFSYTDLEGLQSGAYVLKFWAEFNDLATELIALENFKISTTPCCDRSSSDNNEFTLNFGEEIIDYELSITGSKGAPFTYEDFTQEQITDLQKPAIEASVVALEKAEKASMAADLANEKAGLANQSAINANSATAAANTATQNAIEATENANVASNSAVEAAQSANVATGQTIEAINNANVATQNTVNAIIEANTATQSANIAAQVANEATTSANEAVGQTVESIENANTATQNTINAISEANTATQSANIAAQVANKAKGWTPVFQFENDGVTRQVNKLVGYIGGTGIAPTDNIGSYVKENGYTIDKSEASNFKGSVGNLNAAGDIILSGSISKEASRIRIFNKVFQKFYYNVPQKGMLSFKITPPNNTSPTSFDVTINIQGMSLGYIGTLKITFYKFNINNTFLHLKSVLSCSDNFPIGLVSVGLDADGKLSINYGNSSTLWDNFLSIEIDRLASGYNGGNLNWGTGWECYLETDISNYIGSASTAPEVLSTRGYNDSRYLQLTGGYVTQSFLNTQLGNYATLNGVQTFKNTITFEKSPIVPNGTLSPHAVNLSQLQQYSKLPSVQLITATTSTISFDNLLMKVTMQNGGILNVSSVLVNQEIIVSNPSNTTLVINFTSLSLSYTLAAKSVATFEVLTGNKLLRRSVVENSTLLMN